MPFVCKPRGSAQPCRARAPFVARSIASAITSALTSVTAGALGALSCGLTLPAAGQTPPREPEAHVLPAVQVRDAAGSGAERYAPAQSRSATKTEAPLRDVPQSVQVVTQQVMQDQGAQSLQDALANVPGVAMSSGDGHRDQVTIRGFSAISDQFVDGVRDDALYFRDLSNIERVEVLKGPAAVLYGRGSSGGIVHRTTKKPHWERNGGEAALTLGSWQRQRLELDWNHALNDVAALRLTAARERADSYRDQQFLRRYAFAPSLALRPSAATRLLLAYDEGHDQRVTDFGIPALNGHPLAVPPGTYFGSRFAERDDVSDARMRGVTATLDHAFSDDVRLRSHTRLYDFHLDRRNTLPNGAPVDPVAQTVGLARSAIFRDEQGWFNQTELTLRHTLGATQHRWLLGLELGQQRKWVQSLSAGRIATVHLWQPQLPDVAPFTAAQWQAAGAIPSTTRQRTAALYVQDEMQLAAQWKALLGLRYDRFGQETAYERASPTLERTDGVVSPRAGLVWQPGEGQSYYLSLSRSFQPSAEAFPLAANTVDNPPEVTTNREIGAKWDVLDGNLALTAALFELERTGMKNADPANPLRSINVGTQRVRGLETTASGQLPGRWDIHAGYAYLDGRMTHSLARISTGQLPTQSLPVQGKVPSLTPRHSASLWLMKALPQGWRAGGGLRYVGARYASLTNAVVLPGYVTADLAAFYRTGALEWGLSVKNVTNKRHAVSAHGSVDNLIVPGAPRAFAVTLRSQF